MEFRSLEEFDREFFARYGASQRHGVPYDPFLREAAPPLPAQPEEARESGPLQIMYTVVSYAIIALLAMAILGFVAPLPFGVKLLNVQSGSMQPEYNINTLLWVVPTKFEKIKVGNDVTYRLESGQLTTHRVIEIDRENRRLTTQGIHNSEFAEIIGYEQVRGVVRFHVHAIGGAMEKLSGEQGIYITIMIILAILLVWGASYFLSKKAGQSGK